MVGFRAVVYIHMHQEDAMPTVEPLDSREEKVVTAVREARDELIALAWEQVSYDCTARPTPAVSRSASSSSRPWRPAGPWSRAIWWPSATSRPPTTAKDAQRSSPWATPKVSRTKCVPCLLYT